MSILELPEKSPAATFVAGMEDQLRKSTDEQSFRATRAQCLREARKMFNHQIVDEINDALPDHFVSVKS